MLGNQTSCRKVLQCHHASRSDGNYAIESYCEGPEVDANFVLCEGDLISFEVSDESPEGADIDGHVNVKRLLG